MAKVQPRQKMFAERSNYRLIERSVDFRLYAHLLEERSVEGYQHGLIVYSFMQRAQPLREVLSRDPRRFIASLFERTLESFTRARAERGNLAHRLLDPKDLGVARWSEELADAYAAAHRVKPTVLEPSALRERLMSCPEMDYRVATVHGDLHVGNLFVPVGTDDIVLIDFGRVRHMVPLVVGPACLEVSLTFPPTETRADRSRSTRPCELAHEWLRSIYEFPLNQHAVSEGAAASEWLTQAVRSIRSQVARLEPNPAAYALAVAVYLIRYASYADHATVGDRGLAYELACSLIEQVLNELKGRGTHEAWR